MSDVEIAKASPMTRLLFFACATIAGLCEYLPVVMARAEAKRLHDNDLIVDHTRQIISRQQQANRHE